MKRISMITIMTIWVASLALGYAIVERMPAQNNREDQKAIERVILDGIEAFNRHDALAGTASFTEDADFVNVYGKWSRGATEIERSRKERFETALREAKIKLLELRVRFIRPDVAIAHEAHELREPVKPVRMALSNAYSA